MKRAFQIAIVLAVSLTRAYADESDPRNLFKDGRYDAAAAGFEKLFDRDKKPLDGVNAVIAWRAAGRYSHARTLLARVRPTVPAADTTLIARTELLERKMAELTGTLVIVNLQAESTITIDNKPAEVDAGDKVVDVGIREIVIAHAGCEPLRRNVAVLPDQRIKVDASLTCGLKNGNLHVHVAGLGADAYIDGEMYNIPTKDLDVPIAPGRHHLVVRRMSVTVEDKWLEVPERGTATVEIGLPYRARKIAIAVSGQSGVVADKGGESSVYAGVGFDLVLGMDPKGRGIGDIEVDFGKAHNDVEGLDGTHTYVAMTGGFRFLGPLWQRRLGSTLLALDVDPISIRLLLTTVGTYVGHDDYVFKQYMMFGSATLGLDWKGGRLALVAFPAGFSTWGANSLDGQRASYCGSVALSLNYPLFGF